MGFFIKQRSVSFLVVFSLVFCMVPWQAWAAGPSDTKQGSSIWDQIKIEPTSTPVPQVKTTVPTPKAAAKTTPTVKKTVLVTTPVSVPAALTKTAIVTPVAAKVSSQPSAVTTTAVSASGVTTPAAALIAVPTPTQKPTEVVVAPRKFDEKSPALAIFLATIPGFFIHGLGHYYAGRPIEATSCLLLEGASVYCGWRAYDIVSRYATSMDSKEADGTTSKGNENLPANTGQINAVLALAVGGTLLFLTTWIYDMVGSPQACMLYNKQQRESVSLRLVPQDNASAMVLNWKKSF